MKDWKQLEELINVALRRYEEMYNQTNDVMEVLFSITITNHKAQVQGVNKWVAYLRLERNLRPKGATEAEWETMLIYNQAYKFENTQERLDPDTPWKYDLYEDMFNRLVAGGLEYGEIMKRMQIAAKANAGKPLADVVGANQSDILITSQMPAPLTEDELKYQHYIKQNKS